MLDENFMLSDFAFLHNNDFIGSFDMFNERQKIVALPI